MKKSTTTTNNDLIFRHLLFYTFFLFLFSTSYGQLSMSNNTTAVCNATYYDNGGTNNYTNANLTQTINPGVASGKVQVVFSGAVAFSNYGTTAPSLRVYNGPSTASPLLGTYSNTQTPPTLTSTDATGALTFVFNYGTSTGTAAGWTANISNTGFTVPTIAYSGGPFCQTGTRAVTQTGLTGGTYSASPVGLSINASTGLINLAASSAGTYTVSYSYGSGLGCNSATTSVTIKSTPTGVSAGADLVSCGGNVGLSGSMTNTSTLFSENFESYASNTYISGAWQQYTITSNDSDWYFSSTSPISGSRMLSLYDSWNGAANSYDYGYNNESVAYYATLINATAYTDLKLNFKWRCGGEYSSGTYYDYGRVVWSLNGTTWNDLPAYYQGQTGTQNATNIDLSAAAGQNFYIGFRWRNDDSALGNPSFSIDDISIVGTTTPSISWSGGPIVSGGTTLTPTVNPSSTATYTMTAISNGCSVSDDVIVTVNSTPIISNCPSNITLNAASGACTAKAVWTNPTWSGGWCSTSVPGANYVGTNGGNHYFYVPGPHTWAAAKADAVAKGGKLATIESAAENTFLNNYIVANGISSSWIGYTDEVTEGNFVSVSGVPLSYGNSPSTPYDVYNNWAAVEPNDAGGEDYTAFNSGGFWNDLNGVATLGYFLEYGLIQTAGFANGASNFPVGVTTVTYNAFTPSGVSATCSFTVTVNSTTPSSIAIAANHTSNVCIGTTVTFTATPTGGGASPTYQWKVDGGNVGINSATFSSSTLTSANVVTCVMTSNATACMPSVTSNGITMSMQAAGSALSGTESKTCVVNGTDWVQFYGSTGLYLGAVRANSTDLGNVEMRTFVGSPAVMNACDAPTNPHYSTAYMGRTWMLTSSAFPSGTDFPAAVMVRLPFNNTELASLNTAAETTTTINLQDGGVSNPVTLANMMLTKITSATTENGIANAADCGPSSTIRGITAIAGSGINVLGTTNTQYIDFNVNQFSEFFLHKNFNNSPLPVTLTNFSANCDKHVQLNWTTASEQNSDRFIIEKSRDGQIWNYVNEQTAAGNSTTVINYNQVDENSWSGVTYYRLRQIDFNGEETIYGPISASCEGNESSMTVYPNPNNGSFTIEIASEEMYNNASLILTDMTGKTIANQHVNVVIGTTQILMDNLELQMGTYLVTLRGGISQLKPVKVLVK